MKITHYKLKKSIQNKLLEFFILEVTARVAADLLGIQANSAICRIRQYQCSVRQAVTDTCRFSRQYAKQLQRVKR